VQRVVLTMATYAPFADSPPLADPCRLYSAARRRQRVWLLQLHCGNVSGSDMFPAILLRSIGSLLSDFSEQTLLLVFQI
jgi:hypothetical protein